RLSPVAFVIRIWELFGHWEFVIRHSYLSASIGSTRAARRAGNQHASEATAIRSDEFAINVAGSVGLMPKSRPLNKRVSAIAPTSPMATPILANLSPCRRTSHRIFALGAPRARRIPSSFLRVNVIQERSPYKPI